MKKQLPKNVRQIGNVSDSSKIYVDTYKVQCNFGEMAYSYLINCVIRPTRCQSEHFWSEKKYKKRIRI